MVCSTSKTEKQWVKVHLSLATDPGTEHLVSVYHSCCVFRILWTQVLA